MNKIWKGLEALWTLIKNPSLLYYIAHRPDAYFDRIRRHFPAFTKGLPEISMSSIIETDSVKLPIYSFKPGTSEISDLMLLAGLANKIQPCHYLELGTFRGESLLSVAQVATSCTSVSLSKSELSKMSYPTEEIEAQDHFLHELHESIQLFREDSRTFGLTKMANQPNLIFIDADHHYEAVKADTQNIFRQVDPAKSVIVWHDYLTPSRKIDYQVLSGILDGIANPSLQSRLFSVDTTKCAIYWPFDPLPRITPHPFLPSATFEISITKN